MIRRLALITCAILLVLGHATSAFAACERYEGTGIGYAPGYGNYCGGYGGGCTECVDESYNACVTNGSSCVPGPHNQG